MPMRKKLLSRGGATLLLVALLTTALVATGVLGVIGVIGHTQSAKAATGGQPTLRKNSAKFVAAPKSVGSSVEMASLPAVDLSKAVAGAKKKVLPHFSTHTDAQIAKLRTA